MKPIMAGRNRPYGKARSAFMLVTCIGLVLGGMTSVALAKDVADKDITSHLESEFQTDNSVTANNINVSTSQGVVTLSGSVDNILAKDRAEKIAEATVGVRSVVNTISVLPPIGRTDKKVQQGVENALLADPATDSYEVKTTVDDGVVKLTGEVDSWQEKQLCTTVAKGVKGVVGVKNNIIVRYKTDRPDYEMEKEIKASLKNDLRVDDALIKVKIEDAKVTLTGTVGSLQEKNLARSDAWVSGVDSVDTSGLQIAWWARDDMRRERLSVSRSDEEIEKAVKDAFVYDPRVISFDIDVDADLRIVTLSGVVDNLKAKKAAEADAESTTGVSRVINNIKVRPATVPSDEKLEDRVAKAFLRDPYVERFDIDISPYLGVVYLSGDVHTSWEKNRAETIAEGVKGVVQVVNNIEFEEQWTWKPDWEIREDVKSELFWSPFVDEDEVSVTVDDGIVTLTGKVDTYSERQSAEDNAYEGGAKDVKNDLSVNYKYDGPYYDGAYTPYGYMYSP